jgi:hypothetical protein
MKEEHGWQTAVRMPEEWKGRLASLGKKLAPFVHLQNATIIRAVIERGLATLEREHGIAGRHPDGGPLPVTRGDAVARAKGPRKMPAARKAAPARKAKAKPAKPTRKGGKGKARSAPAPTARIDRRATEEEQGALASSTVRADANGAAPAGEVAP